MWQCVQATLFAWSPQPLYGWRRFLLRSFGAKVGRRVLLRPTVRVTYPWKVEIGEFSWIGDNAELYSLGPIKIGKNSVVSQKCYICTGSHRHDVFDFPIYAEEIVIGDEVWLATDVFVAPGVTIGDCSVVGARSSVFQSITARAIMLGAPAKQVGVRGGLLDAEIVDA